MYTISSRKRIGNTIGTQMKVGPDDFNAFETKVNKHANRIDMLETKIMHLLSNI